MLTHDVRIDDRKAMRENTQWWLGCVFSCQCPSACDWKRLCYKCYRRHCGVQCQQWISSSRNQCSPMRIWDREVKSRSVKEMAELKGMETHRQPEHFIHTDKFIFPEHFFKPKFKSNSFFYNWLTAEWTGHAGGKLLKAIQKRCTSPNSKPLTVHWEWV